MRCHAVNTAIM